MSKQTEVVISLRCTAAARGGVNEDNCLYLETVGKQDSGGHPGGDVDQRFGGEDVSRVYLGSKGCLLVVADGMGGMNAGEVASKIAVETVSKAFRKKGVADMDMTEKNIKSVMLAAIREADAAIKKEAAADKEKEGMGTTIVMLWLLPDVAYYAWCGDSRIYRYHEGQLFQLSHDHSYVCEVLRLSEAEAFDHPDNNIITRSLGNPSDVARPEICGPLQYYEKDIFLLCSDGLCGVVRNTELRDALQCTLEIVEAEDSKDKLNQGNLLLWKVAESNGWHDNVTSLLCYIKQGQKAEAKKVGENAAGKKEKNIALITSAPVKVKKSFNVKRFITIAAACLAVVLATGLWLKMSVFNKAETPITTEASTPPPEQNTVEETEPVSERPSGYSDPLPNHVTEKFGAMQKGEDNPSTVPPVNKNALYPKEGKTQQSGQTEAVIIVEEGKTGSKETGEGSGESYRLPTPQKKGQNNVNVNDNDPRANLKTQQQEQKY